MDYTIPTCIWLNKIDEFKAIIEHRHPALEAFRLSIGETNLNAMDFAAYVGRPEICQLLLPLFPIRLGTWNVAIAQHHIECVTLFIHAMNAKLTSKLTKREATYLLNVAFFEQVSEIARVIMEAGYGGDKNAPDWAKSYVKQLAVRCLATRATERALKHAGLHKDVVPMIVELVAESEVTFKKPGYYY